jgi:type I restriction enzyme S subunit
MNKNIKIQIPKNWIQKTLNEIGTFSKGNGISGEQLKSMGVPCVGYGDLYVKYNIKFSRAQNFIDKSIAKESVAINKGTLLFTATGETAKEIGKCVCYYGEETIYVGGDIFILQAKEIEPLFIAYQQNLFPFIKQKAQFGQGHSVVHIRLDDIKKLSVVYPKNIKEQNKIVKILAKWDEAIELQERLIEKLEMQKKGLMQKLLKPKKDWKKKCLNKLFSFHGGLGISREQLGDKGIPYLHYGDMHKGTFLSVSYDDYTALPKYDIKINGNEDFLMKDGDVVFLDASEDLTGTSRCVVIDNPDNKPFIAGLHTFIARPLDNSLCKWYKKYFTQTQDVQKQFERLSVGFKVYGVNKSSIKNIVVSFPRDIKEQRKITDILNKLDIEKRLHSQKLEIFKKQRKALMQLLLTGTVRVTKFSILR